jgi:hypothetical protein
MPDEKKLDPFKPQQPRIPGVSESAKTVSKPPAPPKPKLPTAPQKPADGLPAMWIAFIVVACLVCVGLAWWSHRSIAKDTVAIQTTEAAAPAQPDAPKLADKLPVGPGEIATTTEMEKVWSSKRFMFRNTLTSEQFPAMVVHLPGGVYWGFSLREPFGICELEYVTDLSRLQTDYHFHAEHPMVGDTCNRAVFDLTKYGTGPNGQVRGEIVQGAAVRPPMAIEIRTKGSQVIAVRME